jgi:hypothetical protein
MKTAHLSGVTASNSKFLDGIRSILLLCLSGIAQVAAEDAAAPAASFPLALPGVVHEIVFCTRTSVGDAHWYANFGYVGTDSGHKYYGNHGRLCKFDVRDGKLTTLIEDLNGALRDPAVSYDAKRILFSWRKAGTDYYHLYECDADGTNQRQLTFGPWDDFEGCYLPDGGIVFVSSRSKRWVNCYFTQVATIFRCDCDGKNIRSLSGNIEQDNSPWVLPDGRLIYTRWEYIDRSQVSFHQLWTMNPDGTGQMVYFGNMHRWTLMIDAKPVPGTNNVVAAISDFHGHADHLGRVSILNNENGPDDLSAVQTVSLHAAMQNNGPAYVPDNEAFSSPYPLSRDLFLTGQANTLLSMNDKGETQTLFVHPDKDALLLTPRPIVARPREPVIPSRIDAEKTTGQLICQNVYTGRRMEGLKPGEIKKLLVLETLPKPINVNGVNAEPMSVMGSFSLERILGTVPVEADGSANFEVPANRSISLVALDENNHSVKRMQSFLSVMPGEVNSCVGCHENRSKAPAAAAPGRLSASRRAPSKIQPVAGIPEVFDFPRDIQPILDRNCLECHSARTRSGGVELTGDRGPIFSMAYYNLVSRMQVFTGADLSKGNFPPRTLGDTVSPLMWKLQGLSEDVELADAFTSDTNRWPRLVKKSVASHGKVRLSPEEIEKVKFWINTGAVYPGTYAAQGASSGIGPWVMWGLQNNIADIKSVPVASAAIERRCISCHSGARAVPKSAVDALSVGPGGNACSGYEDSEYLSPPMRTYFRHRVFNLTHPEDSLMLLAPLAKSAGGFGTCLASASNAASGPVFADVNDPDYQAILAAIRDTGKRLDEITQHDKPNFIPNNDWMREMKRFGILPPDLDPARTHVDPFETEKRYWESLWYHPDQKEQWGPESASPDRNVTCPSK